MLNDEYVAGLVGLVVPTRLPWSHSVQYAHARSSLLCFWSMQGSVTTPFRCVGISNLFIACFLMSVTVKEFLK